MSVSGIRRADRMHDVADHIHIRLFTVDALTLGEARWNTRDVQSPYWRFYQNRDDGSYGENTGFFGSYGDL